MIFLDTHVLVWLHAGLIKKLSSKAASLIETNDLMISQMVRLELQYLLEIGRISVSPEEIINALGKSIGLKESSNVGSLIFDNAMEQGWTRDVFDRLIMAEASFNKSALITKDKKIRKYYARAVW